MYRTNKIEELTQLVKYVLQDYIIIVLCNLKAGVNKVLKFQDNVSK